MASQRTLDQRSTNTLIGVGISIAGKSSQAKPSQVKKTHLEFAADNQYSSGFNFVAIESGPLGRTGNLLISIALNFQKLAHKRLEELKNQPSSPPKFTISQPSESSPLASHHAPVNPEPYSTIDPQPNPSHDFDYLTSPIWWMGLVLMSTGELGNFVSYGFAPASVVAPLGTVALVGNCFVAPILLGEKFRRRDWMGIGLAIIGTVTIVLSSPRNSEALTPVELSHAIFQLGFILYTSLCLATIMLLLCLSNTKWGDQFIGIDVGLCAIAGGFTVLSTKAFSSLLSVMLLDCFNYPITWFMLAVILVTAVLQIVFLNRALKRFDSKHVVPVQFVLFTIMAVIGSTILYGDFRNLGSAQVGNFVFACGFIFTGVYILTREGLEEEEEARRSRRGRRGVQGTSRSTTLAPVLEQLNEDVSGGAPEPIASRSSTEPGSFSIRIRGASAQPDPLSCPNKLSGPSSWRSLQHYFQSPPPRSLRRQRSQPILFPRVFGAPGYYLIASSSARAHPTSHD